MSNETVLFQTRYAKIIFIRPLIAALVPMLWLFIALNSYGGSVAMTLVGCLNIVAVVFLLRYGLLFLWRLRVYATGNFTVTDRRLLADGEGKVIDIFLHQLEGIDYFGHMFIPYPLSRRTLRVRGLGGNVVDFHDVADADQLKYTVEQSIMDRQYTQ